MVKNQTFKMPTYTRDEILKLHPNWFTRFIQSLSLEQPVRRLILDALERKGMITDTYLPTPTEITTDAVIDYKALMNNVRANKLIDPTIGQLNRNQYFKGSEYFSPVPGLWRRFKSASYGWKGNNIFLIYGTSTTSDKFIALTRLEDSTLISLAKDRYKFELIGVAVSALYTGYSSLTNVIGSVNFPTITNDKLEFSSAVVISIPKDLINKHCIILPSIRDDVLQL